MEKKKKGHYSVLELININELNKEIETDHDRRCEKRKLYAAFSRYIKCLEEKLEKEKNFYKRILIKLEIIKIKNEQKKYYEQSTLEIASYALVKNNELYTRQDALEKSSYSLVKKQKNKN